MKKKILIAIPLVCTLMLSGCATVLGGGSKQKLRIDTSNHKSMEAIVSHENGSDKEKVTLPTQVTVKRSMDAIVISSDKNEFKTAVVEPKINELFWVNIVGLGIPAIVDVATGAMWTYHNTLVLTND